MVGAQVEPTVAKRDELIQKCYSLWELLYDEERDMAEELGLGGDSAPVFGPEEDNAPHFPIFIDFDARVRGLDLSNPENRPTWTTVEIAFSDFFAAATLRLWPEGLG